MNGSVILNHEAEAHPQDNEQFKEGDVHPKRMTTAKNTQFNFPSVEKPWLQFFSEEDLQTPLPNLSMYDYLKQTSQSRMYTNALNFYGRHFTFTEFFREVDKVAAAFSAYGVRKGETVSFVSVSVPETVFAIYGLNRLGAVANLIDPRMGIEFIQQMIVNSDSRYLVCVDAVFPKVEKILDHIGEHTVFIQPFVRSLPTLKRMVVRLRHKQPIPYGDCILPWDEFLKKGERFSLPDVSVSGDDVAAIAYTGGTTGISKGVVFTNTGVNAVAFNFKYAGFEIEDGHNFLGMIPVFTSYGLVCGMHMPLCLGLELIPIPRFIPEQFGKLVRQFRPNHMISTPAFYEMLMNSKEVRNMDLSFMITLGAGGDTVNRGLEGQLSEFMHRHGIKYPLAQGYGLSEMSAAVSFCVNDIYKSGSVGIPSITTTVGIFDPETGEELTYGEVGEVCMTGPSMMKEYYNQPEETANVMRTHSDGTVWIHSGDLGYIDKDGFLFINGRVKRMITRFDGHKVFPLNIESLIAANEMVHNCCVIGVRDRKHGQGEEPLALAVFKANADIPKVCRELMEECRARLDERGQPMAVLPVESLPLTGMGKIDYRALEQEYKNYDYTH